MSAGKFPSEEQQEQQEKEYEQELSKAGQAEYFSAKLLENTNDTLVLEFVKSFYKALLQDNLNIAEAFRQSREAIRQAAPYNPTWLAYSFYADPEARIQERSPTGD